MLFKNKIRTSLEGAKQNIQNKFDNERVKIVELTKLKFDKDFKELFAQEPEKVERIAEDMKVRGFDKSQPIILTEDYSILDGNSRTLAAQKAGIKYVPVVFKKFSDKDEAIKYELHLQLDRRNLTDSEIFAMFQKLEAMKEKAKAEGKSTEDYTDAKIGEQLKKSERQVQKMRELTKKADDKTIENITSGKATINQAYNQVKNNNADKVEKSDKLDKTEKIEKGEKSVDDRKSESIKICESKKSESINANEFLKGVHFALDEVAKGKTAQEIIKSL